MITDGDTCRLRIIINKCDGFENDSAPTGMARVKDEMTAGVVDVLIRRLVENFHKPEDEAERAVQRVMDNGNRSIVFPCSVLGYKRLRTPRERLTRQQQNWLILQEMESEESTGVPAIVHEMRETIRHAGDFINPVIRQYFEFIQRLLDAANGDTLRDDDALLRIQSFIETQLPQEVCHGMQ